MTSPIYSYFTQHEDLMARKYIHVMTAIHMVFASLSYSTKIGTVIHLLAYQGTWLINMKKKQQYVLLNFSFITMATSCYEAVCFDTTLWIESLTSCCTAQGWVSFQLAACCCPLKVNAPRSEPSGAPYWPPDLNCALVDS